MNAWTATAAQKRELSVLNNRRKWNGRASMASLAAGHRRDDLVRIFPVYFAASGHFVMNLLALYRERRAGHMRPVTGAQPFHFRSDPRVPVFPLQYRYFRSLTMM